MIDSVKRWWRESKKRLQIAYSALRGQRFIMSSTPGYPMPDRWYGAELPDYTGDVDSEERASLLAKASEPEMRYVATRELRQAYESSDEDLYRTIREVNQMQGNDLMDVLRRHENLWYDRAKAAIRERVEVRVRENRDDFRAYFVIEDPRTTFRTQIVLTAREYHDWDGSTHNPPEKVEYAIESFPDTVLGAMCDDDEFNQAVQPIA